MAARCMEKRDRSVKTGLAQVDPHSEYRALALADTPSSDRAMAYPLQLDQTAQCARIQAAHIPDELLKGTLTALNN